MGSNVQVGGTHYKNMKIQPIDFIIALGYGWPFCVCNVIKYVSRWKHKNGPEDLDKVGQYLDFMHDLKKKNDPSYVAAMDKERDVLYDQMELINQYVDTNILPTLEKSIIVEAVFGCTTRAYIALQQLKNTPEVMSWKPEHPKETAVPPAPKKEVR